jgi:predicted metallo-beta-lactamase superfamily hydrolase
VNGVAHFADDVVAAESDFHAESDFFEKLAIRADGRDAQVGTAEIDSDRKIWHGQKGIRISWLIDDC